MKNEVQRIEKEQEISDIYAGASVIKKLETLMDKVTAQDCTPATVQSAVNCVEAINGLLRTHLEQQRLNLEKRRLDAARR